MFVGMKEKIDLLADRVNLKLEIKISHFKLREGLEANNKNNEEALEFYHFCEDFFNIWGKYMDRLSLLVNEFKREGNTGYLRQIYAEILSEQYEKYLQSLKNLKAPVFLNKSFKLFVDSVSERQKYFRYYNGYFIDNKTGKIENDTAMQESKFWSDLYEKNLQIRSLQEESGSKNIN